MGKKSKRQRAQKTQKPVTTSHTPELMVNSLIDFSNELTGRNQLSSTQTMRNAQGFNFITLDRNLISSTYMQNGIMQVLIDQPVDDAFRGGVELKTSLNEQQLAMLEQYMVENEILETYKQTVKYKRHYGGGALLINAGQDQSQPFKIDDVNEGDPLKFYAVDRWELSGTNDSTLDQFVSNDQPFNYYGKTIDRSNMIIMKGKEAPSLYRGSFQGWGMSEIEKIVRNWNQYIKNQQVTFELLDEAKVDVFKIEGFNKAVSTRDGAQKTAKAVQIAAQNKNYMNALTIDKNDEYEQKNISFSGIAEVMQQIRLGLAGDLRMPLTKLFGLSASGFNSGEDDLENYNGMVESEIRSKEKKGLILVLKVICRKLFGMVPDELDFEYRPLREMSQADKNAEKQTIIQVLNSLLDRGIIDQEQYAKECNANNVTALDIDPNGVDESMLDAYGSETDQFGNTPTDEVNQL